MSFQLSPSLERDLERDLAPRVERAAKAGADQHREDVAGGPRTGEWYYHPLQAGVRYQAAASHEQFQEVLGDYRSSIDHIPTNDPLVWRFGVFGLPQARLSIGELGPPSRGGHASLAKTAERPETLRRLEEAMGGE